jgi:oligosaccharide repeat unit polymerase
MISNNKKKYSLNFNLKTYFLFFLSMNITFSFIFIDNVTVLISLILVFMVYSMYLVKFEPIHPVVWLLPILFLYHFSVIFLDYLNVRTTQNMHEIAFLGWLSIATCSILLIFFCKKISNVDVMEKAFFVNYLTNNFILTLFYSTLLILVMSHNIVFLTSGISSKSQANSVGGLFSILQFSHLWYLLAYQLLLVKRIFIERKFPWKLIIFTFVVSLFTTLNLGERNVFLSFCIISIITVYLFYRPRKIVVFSFGAILLVLIPILGSLKNIFTRDKIQTDNSGVLVDLFSGEFLSVGRNLEVLLLNNYSSNYFYGLTFIWDIGRSIVPGIIYPFQNAVGWFNNTYYGLNREFGYGFTLTGEGLINFGILGVIIWYLIFCGILSVLYNKGTRSLGYLSLYLPSIPYFAYAIRADFSNLFSPIIKSILLPLLLILLITLILKKQNH